MSVLLLFAAAVLVGAESIAELKSKASAGDVDAQARLAAAYFQGEGVPEDHAQALRWAAVPAEQDDLFCAQMIAQIHYKGTGVKRDLPAALRWFRNAAILGDSTAAFTAGLMMEEGHGVAKNPVEALSWYRLAMELPSGSPAASVRVKALEAKLTATQKVEATGGAAALLGRAKAKKAALDDRRLAVLKAANPDIPVEELRKQLPR
jgi:TPR repeat protein